METKPSFEEAMARLDEIVQLLDHRQLTLEQSLALYKEGAELIVTCDGILKDAKLEIDTLFPPAKEPADEQDA